MTIPFVIDNQQHTMASILNDLLAQHKGHSLDIATAYFNVGGWQLLRDGLNRLGNFRLLLGDEPEAGSDLGLREGRTSTRCAASNTKMAKWWRSRSSSPNWSAANSCCKT